MGLFVFGSWSFQSDPDHFLVGTATDKSDHMHTDGTCHLSTEIRPLACHQNHSEGCFFSGVNSLSTLIVAQPLG